MITERISTWTHEKAAKMRANPTPAERRLTEALREHLLIEVQAQVPMLNYIADIYIPAARVVIELDGKGHLSRQAYDRERDQRLAANGIITIRYPNRLIAKQLHLVIQNVIAAVRPRLDPTIALVRPKQSSRKKSPGRR